MTSSTHSNSILFTAALSGWAKIEMKGEVQRLKTAVAFDIFRNLVEVTPVGNPDLWRSLKIGYKSPSMSKPRTTEGKPPKGYVGGTARASWFISADRPEATPVVKNDPVVGGNLEVANFIGKGIVEDLKFAGNTIWIANNLPYIERIMEDGWSTQAPPSSFSAVAARMRRKWGLT